MAEEIISTYTAAWNFEEHVGTFNFTFSRPDASGPGVNLGNYFSPVIVSDPAEFQLMIDLLRNESPVMYDGDAKKLVVRWEQSGEGEINSSVS